MNNYSDKIKIEIVNIDHVFTELPDSDNLHLLSPLELAGVAALLHNFYNGIENIIKRILIIRNVIIPYNQSWHKELLNLASQESIISENLKIRLGDFLAFRHYFSHGYAINLSAELLEPLVQKASSVYQDFKNEIEPHLD